MTVDVRHVFGFVRGKQCDLLVVRRLNAWVECSVAAAYDELCGAAALDGFALTITSGWRSMAEQTKLFEARKCTCGKGGGIHSLHCPTHRFGPAARPGYSAHQSGRALDLALGMTTDDLRLGRETPAFRWLNLHAKKYGFARTVGVEPWHWEHMLIHEDRPDHG